MKKIKNEGKFFDLNSRLSFNANYYFFMGGRGIGKTFSVKEKAIKDFKRKGKETVYCRRYEKDFNERMYNKFFDEDLKAKFPDDELEVKKGVGRINGKPFIHMMALSTADAQKGLASFDNVGTVIYDEFAIKRDSFKRYLPDEAGDLEDVLETVFRLREGIVICLANNTSLINPLFDFYKIHFPSDTPPQVYRRGNIYAELIESSEEFQKAKNEHWRAKAIEGTAYYDYAFKNTAYEDSSANICAKTGKLAYHCTLIINGKGYGVWKSNIYRTYWISPDVEDGRLTYTFDLDNVGGTSMMLNYKSVIIKMLIESFYAGSVYFETQDCKKAFLRVVK